MDEMTVQKNQNEAEFFLATVTSYSSSGMKIRLDGQSEEMTKRYKLMYVKPVPEGARVVVMKISGTYVVLGEVKYPLYKNTISDLATTTTSVAAVVTKVNQILGWLRNQGFIN